MLWYSLVLNESSLNLIKTGKDRHILLCHSTPGQSTGFAIPTRLHPSDQDTDICDYISWHDSMSTVAHRSITTCFAIYLSPHASLDIASYINKRVISQNWWRFCGWDQPYYCIVLLVPKWVNSGVISHMEFIVSFNSFYLPCSRFGQNMFSALFF